MGQVGYPGNHRGGTRGSWNHVDHNLADLGPKSKGSGGEEGSLVKELWAVAGAPG